MRTTSENAPGGESEKRVSHSEKLRENAMGRVRLAVRDAEYHEGQARASRARAASVVVTWELCSHENPDTCCANPDSCKELSNE